MPEVTYREFLNVELGSGVTPAVKVDVDVDGAQQVNV